jgi:hypothetical protein
MAQAVENIETAGDKRLRKVLRASDAAGRKARELIATAKNNGLRAAERKGTQQQKGR